MEYVALTAATVVFTLALHFFRVVAVAHRILASSSEALATIRAASLDDDAKERVVQRAAIAVMRALGILVAGVAASLLLALAVVYPGMLIDAYSMDALLTAAGNWYFIAGSCLFVIAAMILAR